MALESCEVIAIDNKNYFFRLSGTQETDGNKLLKSTILNNWYKYRGYDLDPKFYLMPINLVKFNNDGE
jgi:hypothetical protein